MIDTGTPQTKLRKVLFVCSKNRWRSPTAESVFRRFATLSVRSAGTARSAVRTVTGKDIEWADLVFAMEHQHKRRLVADYPQQMRSKTIHVLDIPDDYQYMDEELVEMLRDAVTPLLNLKDN